MSEDDRDDIVIPTPEEVDDGEWGPVRRSRRDDGEGLDRGRHTRPRRTGFLKRLRPGVGERRTRAAAPSVELEAKGHATGVRAQAADEALSSEAPMFGGVFPTEGPPTQKPEKPTVESTVTSPASTVPSWTVEEEAPDVSADERDEGEGGIPSWSFDEEPPSPVEDVAAAVPDAQGEPRVVEEDTGPPPLRRIRIDKRAERRSGLPSIPVPIKGPDAVRAKAEGKGHRLGPFEEGVSHDRVVATCVVCGEWAAVVQEIPEGWGPEAAHEQHIGNALSRSCR